MRAGFIPQAYVGPLKWWAPVERMVVEPADANIPQAVRGHFAAARSTSISTAISTRSSPAPPT